MYIHILDTYIHDAFTSVVVIVHRVAHKCLLDMNKRETGSTKTQIRDTERGRGTERDGERERGRE